MTPTVAIAAVAAWLALGFAASWAVSVIAHRAQADPAAERALTAQH